MLEKSLADIPSSWVKVNFDPANIMRSTMAWYRELGLPLIPVWGTNDGVCLCKDGADCESAGKHPITSLVRSGVKNASLEAEDHRLWLKRHPDMNIGTSLPGFTVIDCDSREAFLVIRKKFDLSLTLTIRTGRGFQLIFRGETRSRTGISTKVDIKSGTNAYVVGAASLHRNGRRYAVWQDNPIADLPCDVEAWIMDDKPPKLSSSSTGDALLVGATITSIGNSFVCVPKGVIGLNFMTSL
jgi:Bifunctional DNA primase/polymerase, N-terminal